MSRLTNLKSLYLDGTLVSGEGLAHLSGLTNLKLLYLDGTQVSGEGLAHLRELTNLKIAVAVGHEGHRRGADAPARKYQVGMAQPE